MENNYWRIRRISENLTDKELELGWKIFNEIQSNYPEGFTMLSHLEKIPDPKNPGEFFYEYEISRPVGEFILKIHEAYPNREIASAVTGRIISDAFCSNG
jgi:hypothetical protein